MTFYILLHNMGLCVHCTGVKLCTRLCRRITLDMDKCAHDETWKLWWTSTKTSYGNLFANNSIRNDKCKKWYRNGNRKKSEEVASGNQLHHYRTETISKNSKMLNGINWNCLTIEYVLMWNNSRQQRKIDNGWKWLSVSLIRCEFIVAVWHTHTYTHIFILSERCTLILMIIITKKKNCAASKKKSEHSFNTAQWVSI